MLTKTILSRFDKIEVAYWTIIFSLVLLGLYKRFSLPLVPFTGPDSIGYLGVAVRQIMSGEFHCIAERSWPYPGFLTLLINISPNYKIIPFAQHLLGCMAALVFGFTWWMCRNFSTYSNFSLKIIYLSIGCFACYYISFADYFVFIENWTHPESISAILQMILVLIFVKLQSSEKPRSFLVYSLFFLCFLNLLTIFQPRLKLLLIIGIFFTALSAQQKNQTKSLIKLYFASFLIIILTQIIPFKNYCSKYQVRHTQALTLFAANMNMISKVIDEDLKKTTVSHKNSLAFVEETFKQAQNKDISKKIGFGWYETLGYNICFFLDPSFYNKILEYEGGNDRAANFYQKYFIRGLIFKPKELCKKIISQLRWAFYRANIFAFNLSDLSSSWEYTAQTLNAWPDNLKGHFYEDYLSATQKMNDMKIQTQLNMPQNHFSIVNFAYRVAPSLGILVLLGAFCFFRLWGKKENLLLFLLLINGAGFLTIALGLSTEPPRYVSDQASLLIFLCAYSIYGAVEKIAFVLKRDR